MERPVEFGSHGKRLKGIVHVPEGDHRARGVVFLNAGLKYRVGPFRIYVKIARRLCQEGFPSLRFDLPGVGNSEGEIVDPHYDCFETSQVSDAVDFFRKEVGVADVTLLGMCAGSRTALRTAAKDPRIDSLVLVSFPITFMYANSLTARHSSKSVGGKPGSNIALQRYYMSYYLRRCTDFQAWLKFLTLRADTRHIVKLIVGSIYARLRGRHATNHCDGGILDSWRSLLSSGRRTLLIYGKYDDPLIKDLKEHTDPRTDSRDETARPSYDLRIIQGASHTFPELEAQRQLIDEITAWLTDENGRGPRLAGVTG